jgi:hypothetical protein
MGFRQLDYESAFVIMGATIMGSAPSVFINIKGHRGLFWGGDTIVEKKETCSCHSEGHEAAEGNA